MQVQLTKQEAIEEMTRRLVEFYRPVRIYLFGSEARGEAGPDSDLDFLVVVSDDAPEEILRPGAGRRAVRGTGFAKDIVPWRKTDFEERAAWVVASLPATVVREGRLLYESEEPINRETAAKLDAARAEGGEPVSLEEVKLRYGL
jgi:hypothetical protein